MEIGTVRKKENCIGKYSLCCLTPTDFRIEFHKVKSYYISIPEIIPVATAKCGSCAKPEVEPLICPSWSLGILWGS